MVASRQEELQVPGEGGGVAANEGEVPGLEPQEFLDHELSQPGAGWIRNDKVWRSIDRGQELIDRRADGVDSRTMVGGVCLQIPHGGGG